jgi:CelD/BcsL family acetyltransferase involved in cellulose biosynthesis
LPDLLADWEESISHGPDRQYESEKLVAASPGSPPFADPRLVAGLHRVFRPADQFRLATIRNADGTPAAQIGLVLRRTRNGPVPVWQLEGGPRNQGSLTEMLVGSQWSIGRDLLESIRTRDEWDLMELRAVPADGPLAMAAREVGATVRSDVPAHGIPVDGDIPIMSSGRRRELNRLRRKMTETTSFVVGVRTPESHDWRESLAAFASFHARRWSSTGSPSPFADPEVTSRFVNWLVKPQPGVNPIATVITNESTGAFAGVVLGLVGGNAMHAWRMAYDPKFKPFSPGIQLLTAMAELARERGLSSLELGRGAEPYKQSWNCVRHERVVVRWHRKTRSTRVVSVLARLTGRAGLRGWGG